MKNVLLDKGIITPSGEISKDKINLVAGAITQPFAEMVWVTTGGDMETVNRLTDVLVTMNTPADRGKLFKIIKLNSEHIRFVLDCMRENTTKVRNIKQYLKAALFNAPSTIGNYYTSLVAHDMASGALAPRKPKYGDPDYYSFKPGESL